jgi:Uma2 family endonuclease
MTAEEYLAWHQGQTDRYEYVDGAPRLKFVAWDGPCMMVGATQAHVRLAGNAFALLRERLRGHRCRPAAADGKVVTPAGNYRYPDVAVDCGAYDPKASVLGEPVIVVEIWSKSTHWIDTTRKLEDYKSIASMRHILFLSQDEVRGQLWTRVGDWQLAELAGLEAQASLGALGLDLPFAALYEDMGLG